MLGKRLGVGSTNELLMLRISDRSIGSTGRSIPPRGTTLVIVQNIPALTGAL